MNNGQLLDFCNFIIRKETEGNLITPEQVNILLPVVSKEHFTDLYKLYEKVIFSSDAFKRFRQTSTITLSGGLGTIPTDYWHCSTIILPTSNYEVDFVTDLEWSNRLTHPIKPPTSRYPIARFYKTGTNVAQLQVSPSSITSVIMTYLRYPTEPVFDYYRNIMDEVIYLPAGTTHTWVTGEVDSSGNDKTTGNPAYTSTSVELDWNEDDKIMIAYSLLQKIGLNLNDQIKTQYSIAKETQLGTQ